MDEVSVVLAAEAERYEIRRGSELLGFATARRRNGVVILPHVEIALAYRGKDFANRLVRGALDDIAAKGERIVAQCPFVIAFLRRNPQYARLKL